MSRFHGIDPASNTLRIQREGDGALSLVICWYQDNDKERTFSLDASDVDEFLFACIEEAYGQKVASLTRAYLSNLRQMEERHQRGAPVGY